MKRQQEYQMIEKVRGLILDCVMRGQRQVTFKVSDDAGLLIHSYFGGHGYIVQIKDNHATITIPDEFLRPKHKDPLTQVSKNMIIALSLMVLMVPSYFLLTYIWGSEFSDELLLPIFFVTTLLLVKKFCK